MEVARPAAPPTSATRPDAGGSSLGAATATDCGPAGLVVIPAHNEEGSLGNVLSETLAYWPRERVLVVDDGSADRTSEIARGLGVHCARHATNLGYGAALQTGFMFAERHGYDFVVLLDADGQHDPRYLSAMARTLTQSPVDLVIGSRFAGAERVRVSPIRRFAMRFFARLTRACTGIDSTDTSSGFKAIRARLYSELKRVQFADFHAELMIYLKLRGFAVAELPVVMRERKSGLSMYTWPKLLLYPVRTLLGMAAGAAEALRWRAASRS